MAVPISKEENKILSLLDKTYLSPQVLALPSQYYIGHSSVCDVACPYCPRQYYNEAIDRGLMRLEDFHQIVPYLKVAENVGLFGLGEPFLHPQFFGFLKALKDEGIHVFTSTHGGTLTPAISERLVEMHLDEIDLSIDAPRERLFRFLRGGLSLRRVMQSVDYLNQIKERQKSQLPEIHIGCAISHLNLRYMPQMVTLAHRLKASCVVFTNLIIVNPEELYLGVAGNGKLQQNLKKAQAKGRKLGVEVKYFYQNPFPWQQQWREDLKGAKRFFCSSAWDTLIIERNGSVKLCCYSDEVYGNCFKEPIDTIINSSRFMDLRQRLLEGNPPDCCKSCGMLQAVAEGQKANLLAQAKALLHSIHADNDHKKQLLHKIEAYERLAY